MATYSVDRPFGFTTYKCFYDDCIPPPDPDTIPPADTRPANFKYWSDTSLWNTSLDGYVTSEGGAYGIPQNYDNVKIIAGKV